MFGLGFIWFFIKTADQSLANNKKQVKSLVGFDAMFTPCFDAMFKGLALLHISIRQRQNFVLIATVQLQSSKTEFKFCTETNPATAQKMKFSIKDYLSKCDRIHRKKSLMQNFIFVQCARLVSKVCNDKSLR